MLQPRFLQFWCRVWIPYQGYRYPNPTLESGYRYLLGWVSVPLVSHQVSIPASKGIDTPLLFHLVSVPRKGYRYPSPLWDLSIDTSFRVPIPAAWKQFLDPLEA
ncbi:hypothetical protein GQ457_06G011350 [Hibiscus cannabinus]